MDRYLGPSSKIILPRRPSVVNRSPAVCPDEIDAYVEPLGVGDALPSLPIFLSPDRYIPAPLEETYQQAWDVFPALLKGLMGGNG